MPRLMHHRLPVLGMRGLEQLRRPAPGGGSTQPGSSRWRSGTSSVQLGQQTRLPLQPSTMLVPRSDAVNSSHHFFPEGVMRYRHPRRPR